MNILNLISWLDWPWKTTLKWPFECPNPSTVSKDTMKSAELYSQSQLCLTIGFALKNYPKMTLWLSKSVHWIKRYSDIYFEVSWFVQSQLIWSNFWICLENYPKMTLWMSKSVHWIKRYSDNYFGVSWFIQSQLMWSYDWIGHEKLPQNDPLNVQIHSLDQKLLLCYVYFCIYIASIRPIGLVSSMWKVIITEN